MNTTQKDQPIRKTQPQRETANSMTEDEHAAMMRFAVYMEVLAGTERMERNLTKMVERQLGRSPRQLLR